MVSPSANPLDDGWEALRAGRWQIARERFSEAVASNGSPEAFEGLSWAAWWLDDAEALIEAREEAFRRYRERDDAASAARMATWLAADHLDFHGAVAVAGGWLDRARRLLEPLPLGPEHGWCSFHLGYVAGIKGDTASAEEHGIRAAALGRELGVPDLEMLGLALQGKTLVAGGRVRDGMRCLDEASAIALAGEATIPISSAWTCCFLVTACTQVLDYERAFSWCDRIAEFAERYGSRYMLGFCRDEYATIHLWRGEWDRAERALHESIEALSVARTPMVGGPVAQLAELRRRQGRAEECERLLEQAGASPAAQLCRARLALDRDEPDRAVDLAERVLRGIDRGRPLARVPVLEVLVLAHVARGALGDAASAAERLTEVAKAVDTKAMRAVVHLSGGRVAAAAGHIDRARPLLEDAVDGFDRCGARFDGACARIELARVLGASGRASDALREARAARDGLRELGARVDAERAERLIARCEAGGGEGEPRVPVSRRERDVLSLLAEGLTNREISERLFISEHTVHRHVTNILRKLDLPTRAAAAAYAARFGLVGRGRQ